MHAAYPRAHRQKRREKRLHVFRIPHDRRKRYVPGELCCSCPDCCRSWASQRRAQGLRGSLQEVASQQLEFFCPKPDSAKRVPTFAFPFILEEEEKAWVLSTAPSRWNRAADNGGATFPELSPSCYSACG